MRAREDLSVEAPWSAVPMRDYSKDSAWQVVGVTKPVSTWNSEEDARVISCAPDAMDLIQDIVMGRVTPEETLKRSMGIMAKYEDTRPRCYQCGRTGELTEHDGERMHAECVGRYEQVDDERHLKAVL